MSNKYWIAAMIFCAFGLSIHSFSQSGLVKIADLGTGPYGDMAIQGGYAYCAAYGAGLDILDISDTGNIRRVSNLNWPGSLYRVKVRGNHAFVGNAGNGLSIVDVSDPLNPLRISCLPELGHISDLDIYDDKVYAIGNDGSSWINAIHIIDVTKPYDPIILGSYMGDEPSLSVSARGNTLFVGKLGGFWILDASSPADIKLLSSVRYTNEQEGTVPALIPTNDALYVSVQGFYISRLEIYDIANLAKPVQESSLELDYGFYRMLLSGNMLVGMNRKVTINVQDEVFQHDGTLRIVDVSDLHNPVILSEESMNGLISCFQLAESKLYISLEEHGLKVMDVSDWGQPAIIGAYNDSHDARCVARNGNITYVGGDDRGIQVLDTSRPESPLVLNQVDFQSPIVDMSITGQHLVVLHGFLNLYGAYHGLRIFDISLPASPVEIGRISGLPVVQDIQCLGDWLYVACYDSGVYIYNLTDPTTPELAAIYTNDTETHRIMDIQLQGSLLVVLNIVYGMDEDTSKLELLDVSDPYHPVLLGGKMFGGAGFELALGTNHAYIADNRNLVTVIDYSQPDQPTFVNTVNTRFYHTRCAVVAENTLFVTDDETIQAFDLLNPDAPVLQYVYRSLSPKAIPSPIREKTASNSYWFP
ncbi:MAG: hypothetical protein JXQ27_07565 [Acidobacteria bacterium]|nr:hypothetical protein [Acidobacteriota bacterium]